jgi:hypothetical protein
LIQRKKARLMIIDTLEIALMLTQQMPVGIANSDV